MSALDSPDNRVMVAVNKDGRVQFCTQCIPPHHEVRQEDRIRAEGYEVLWVSLPLLRALQVVERLHGRALSPAEVDRAFPTSPRKGALRRLLPW